MSCSKDSTLSRLDTQSTPTPGGMDSQQDPQQDPSMDLELDPELDLIADLLEKLENLLEDAFAVGLPVPPLADGLSSLIAKIAKAIVAVDSVNES